MSLAFGSGKTGMTYTALLGADKLAEMRRSYFPKTGVWHITPGQESLKDKKMGKLHDGEFPRKCVLCHAVALSEGVLMPEPRFMGVGCESCHGPGGVHIKAISSGKSANLFMEPLKKATGERINNLCGGCHMTAKMVKDMHLPKGATDRFQPYGLSLSQCFQKSGGKLTCVTCHNPHQDASHDLKKYDALCMSCHTDVKPATSQPPSPASPKPCPVNKKSDCVSCHMPLQKIFKETDIPTEMRDHYIRVRR